MRFEQFIEKLQLRLAQQLPGEEVQFRMAPLKRIRTSEFIQQGQLFKTAAVLLLLYPCNGIPHLVCIKRTQYDGAHSGQIAFPGGKKEEYETPSETAKRETHEEIGVDPNKIVLLGEMTPVYIPASNYMVHPFVGYASEINSFVPQDREVQRIFSIPAYHFLNEQNIRTTERILFNKQKSKVPCYIFEDEEIWGATALMLSEFSEIIKSIC